MRLRYPEFKWVVIGCAIGVASTAYQCTSKPENPPIEYKGEVIREYNRYKIPLPPLEPPPDVPEAPKPTKRGLCKMYNHSGTACEVYH